MFYPELAGYIHERVTEYNQIPEIRKQLLQQLADFVREHSGQKTGASLNFICTHNSRRSHLAAIWAQTAAAYYQIPRVYSYSGGTEATAFNPRAAAALKRAGFQIEQTTFDHNPVYQVRHNNTSPAIAAFSKVYDQAPNPAGGYCAVLTCSEADRACPLVSGALCRIALPYEDPKAADHAPDEAAVYDQRCLQIGREILYAFSEAG